MERVAVQMMEARRLALPQDVAHGRIALLLLDNVAETLLHRQTNHLISMDSLFDGTLQGLRAMSDLPERFHSFRDELEAKVTSKRRRKKIDQYFDEKVDFISEREGERLTPTTARCLKKLHKYRNLTYHRDEVRPETLATAVRIYFFLCCDLLRSLGLPMMGFNGKVPSGLVDLFDGAPPERFAFDFGAAKTVADHLASDMHLDHGQVKDELAGHVLGRLDSLEQDFAYVAEDLGLTSADVLILLQIREDGDYPYMPVEELRRKRVPLTSTSITEWRIKADQIRQATDARSAFALFADIEDAFEPIEGNAAEVIDRIERESQRQVDLARGK